MGTRNQLLYGKERIIEILARHRSKLISDKTSVVVQAYEFDEMISEILSEKIKCKFENMQSYCKHKNNKIRNSKVGMKCCKAGCPYYTATGKL